MPVNGIIVQEEGTDPRESVSLRRHHLLKSAEMDGLIGSSVATPVHRRGRVIEKYISINRHLRSIAAKCRDADAADFSQDDAFVRALLTDYIQRDVRDLLQVWPVDLNNALVQRIGEQVGKTPSERQTFDTIMTDLLPRVEDQIDQYFAARPSGDLASAIVDLLHPVVFEASYSNYKAGRLRESVLNAVLAVFDLLRARTGIDKDGAQLVAEAFSLDRPVLIVSTLETESGRNEQKGFIQILQGVYLGVRNPQAHSLASKLDMVRAGQYLVMTSLLAQTIDGAHRCSTSEE